MNEFKNRIANLNINDRRDYYYFVTYVRCKMHRNAQKCTETLYEIGDKITPLHDFH